MNLGLRPFHLKGQLPEMEAAVQEVLLSRGKKFRPSLIYAFSRFLGIEDVRVEPFATAAEWVHAATLCHDDVLDVALTRRDLPSLPAVLTQSRSILTGDILLARVVWLLANAEQPYLLKRMAEVVEDLCMGEWLQLEDRMRFHQDLERVKLVQSFKTASLWSWCLEVPIALHPEVQLKHLKAIRAFAKSFGVAYQTRDDYEDQKKDLEEGMLNSSHLYRMNWDIEFMEKIKSYFQSRKTAKADDSVPFPFQPEEFSSDRLKNEIIAVLKTHEESAMKSLKDLEDLVGQEGVLFLQEVFQSFLPDFSHSQEEVQHVLVTE